MAEIAAVRVLSRKQRANKNQGPILILTTGIITGAAQMYMYQLIVIATV